jgi:hypothetical protein
VALYALESGWNDWAELKEKESDFGALRGRDYFNKLVAEVQATSGSNVQPKE